MIRFNQHVALLSALTFCATASLSMTGCGDSTPTKSAATASAKDDHAGHDHAGHDHAGHDHAADETHAELAAEDDHGATTTLGEQAAGGFTLKASRDGDLVAGKEAPIDIDVQGAGKVAAVRFWIGVEDGAGSMKAKAELEHTTNWHTHAEVPNPLPAGAKLWVEIEAEGGAKYVVSFDLKS